MKEFTPLHPSSYFNDQIQSAVVDTTNASKIEGDANGMMVVARTLDALPGIIASSIKTGREIKQQGAEMRTDEALRKQADANIAKGIQPSGVKVLGGKLQYDPKSPEEIAYEKSRAKYYENGGRVPGGLLSKTLTENPFYNAGPDEDAEVLEGNPTDDVVGAKLEAGDGEVNEFGTPIDPALPDSQSGASEEPVIPDVPVEEGEGDINEIPVAKSVEEVIPKAIPVSEIEGLPPVRPDAVAPVLANKGVQPPGMATTPTGLLGAKYAQAPKTEADRIAEKAEAVPVEIAKPAAPKGKIRRVITPVARIDYHPDGTVVEYPKFVKPGEQPYKVRKLATAGGRGSKDTQFKSIDEMKAYEAKNAFEPVSFTNNQDGTVSVQRWRKKGEKAGGAGKMTDSQQNSLTGNVNLMKEFTDVEDHHKAFHEKGKTGVIRERLIDPVRQFFHIQDTEQKGLKGKMDVSKFKIARMLNGPGVLTKDDLNRASALAPNIYDKPEVFQTDMKRVKDELKSSIETWIAANSSKAAPELMHLANESLEVLNGKKKEVSPYSATAAKPASSTETKEAAKPAVPPVAAPKKDEVRVQAPNGKTGTIPKSQLEEALKSGYKQL